MLRRNLLLCACATFLLFSCAGKAATKPVEAPAVVPVAPNPAPAVTQPEPVKPVTEAPAFDPTKVSVEQKQTTFIDIRAFIESLNTIIQHKDYEVWRSHLTAEFIAYYSDPAVLAQISEYPVLKRAGIKLSTLKDYFISVVYPSRQNDRVDDIEFVSERRVKAITISAKGDRQILYNLEKIGDTWKIGIGR